MCQIKLIHFVIFCPWLRCSLKRWNNQNNFFSTCKRTVCPSHGHSIDLGQRSIILIKLFLQVNEQVKMLAIYQRNIGTLGKVFAFSSSFICCSMFAQEVFAFRFTFPNTQWINGKHCDWQRFGYVLKTSLCTMRKNQHTQCKITCFYLFLKESN